MSELFRFEYGQILGVRRSVREQLDGWAWDLSYQFFVFFYADVDWQEGFDVVVHF